MEEKEISRKIAITLICLVLFSLCGCNVIIEEMDKPYHEFAWHKSGKTITEARRDCDECIYETRKAAYPSQTLFDQCMNLRGYQLYKAKDILANQVPIQQVPGWESFGMHNDVAGQK